MLRYARDAGTMSRPLIPAQRRERILEYLALHKILASTDLSQWLGVSEATIRRDLEWLEEEGTLERTHGGATLSQRLPSEPEYMQRALRCPEEKRLIGMTAARLIQEGDIVFINSGTTTTQVIRHVRPRKEITIITNNLAAALETGDAGFDLILVGGEFQHKSNSVAGRFAIDNLGQVYASKTFIGVDGISLKHGYTIPSNAEAEVLGVMLDRTHGPVYVVADHSKWGVVSNFEVAPVSSNLKLITDTGLDEHARQALADCSVEIILANPIPINA
jgi:DeoR/GlpR family transcriptional regulator of sugar metabolism